MDLKQNLGNSGWEEKLKFSSECQVRVFANCSKNQNKVLKCTKYRGLCKKKSPMGGEIQEL